MTLNATSNAPVIDVRGVQKIYRPGLVKRVFSSQRVHALNGVDLRVGQGEIFGLLGPNGAGKSTLVKILLGLVRPTALDGTMLGDRVGRREAMSRVGYLPEQHRFPPYLTGRQVVQFFGNLTGLAGRDRTGRIDAVIDQVGMSDAQHRKVGTYSKGMRQRIGLAQALVHAPDLVILDEPTDGVDPVARREIRDVLIEAKNAGTAVLVNSHLLGELELMCDRVAIMVHGQLRKQGTIDELALGSEHYEIGLAQPADMMWLGQQIGVNFAETAPPPGKAIAGRFARGTFRAGDTDLPVSIVESTGQIQVDTVDTELALQLFDLLRQKGLIIRKFAPFRPTLEELFISAVTEGEGGSQ